MAQVTLLCGPACAGKSTLARQLEAADALVLSYDREAWARGVRDGRPSQQLMHEIDDDFHRQVADAVAAERPVVLDASLSTRNVRDRWRMRCGAMGAAQAQANPEIVELIGSVERADIDYALVREHIGAWVERIELEYLP